MPYIEAMAKAKYYLELTGEAEKLTCKLLTLDGECLCKQELTIVDLDESDAAQSLQQLEEGVLRLVRQCVVSANAAPGKIAHLSIHCVDEPFFFALNKDASQSLIIHSHDGYDEQLQQLLDLLRLTRRSTKAYSFLPWHSWLLDVLGGQQQISPKAYYADAIALCSSDFYDAEKDQWFPNALKALKLSANQLPAPKNRKEALKESRTGLITSVANFSLMFI